MKRIFTPRKLKRILIVGDDATGAKLYQEKLESERYDVELAGDSKRAMVILEVDPVDLVILDMSKSLTKGVEFLKAIRSRPGTETVPVIVLSNHYFGGHRQAAEEAGAERCIIKTDCTPRQLLAIVREALAHDSLSHTRQLPAAARERVDVAGATSSEPGGTFEAKVVRAFFEDAPPAIRGLRMSYRVLVHSAQEGPRLGEVSEMQRQASVLASAAGLAGFRRVAQLASGLEALLVQVHDKPGRITPSVVRTMAQAVDLLATLFDQSETTPEELLQPPAILVVDDEIISREAVCSALGKAGFDSVSVADSKAAAVLLEQRCFDLIFLDVEMPGQNGLDLCGDIRSMAMNHSTPVVFVTSHSDLASRARSSISGGSDFIAKPFLSAELTVKALTWLFKVRPPAPTLVKKPGENGAAIIQMTSTRPSRLEIQPEWGEADHPPQRLSVG